MNSVQTMLQNADLFNFELHLDDGPLDPSYIALLRQSRADEPLEELRHRYHNEGYLCLIVQRTLLRNNIPGNRAIGVHYDQIFLRHGEPTAITAWVPIGDVSLEGGGLIYLEHGYKLGQRFEDDFAKKAAVAGLSEEERKDAFNRNTMTTGFLADGPAGFARQHNSRWLLTPYEAGDVVFHKPRMIHASTINQDPENRIRLGTDLRFVNASRPYDSRWCKPYTFDDGI